MEYIAGAMPSIAGFFTQRPIDWQQYEDPSSEQTSLHDLTASAAAPEAAPEAASATAAIAPAAAVAPAAASPAAAPLSAHEAATIAAQEAKAAMEAQVELEETMAAESGRAARAGKWIPTRGNSTRSSVYGRSCLPDELQHEQFPLRDQAEAIFILADKDHDGRLNLSELRDIMHRPELAEMAMENYSKGREDERVTLEEFLAEVKRTFLLSAKAAERMLFIYEKTLKKAKAKQAEEAAAQADAAKAAAQAEMRSHTRAALKKGDPLSMSTYAEPAEPAGAEPAAAAAATTIAAPAAVEAAAEATTQRVTGQRVAAKRVTAHHVVTARHVPAAAETAAAETAAASAPAALAPAAAAPASVTADAQQGEGSLFAWLLGSGSGSTSREADPEEIQHSALATPVKPFANEGPAATSSDAPPGWFGIIFGSTDPKADLAPTTPIAGRAVGGADDFYGHSPDGRAAALVAADEVAREEELKAARAADEAAAAKEVAEAMAAKAAAEAAVAVAVAEAAIANAEALAAAAGQQLPAERRQSWRHIFGSAGSGSAHTRGVPSATQS